MTYRVGLVGVLLVAITAGLAVAQTPPSIQGAWRVTEVTVTGANAASNTSPQPGIFIFTKGHYSIITVNSSAPRKALASPASPEKLTDAEKMARYDAWNEFTANSGTYQVTGNTLTTNAVVAKNPGVMGTTQAREFKIEGNTLILVQKSAAGQPASQTTTRLTRIE
jgi:hypothetical protein